MTATRPRFAILTLYENGSTEWLSEGDDLQAMIDEYESLSGERHILVTVLADTDFPEYRQK